jgi:RNA polymerase sigma-70 factor (ECF subfamily)
VLHGRCRHAFQVLIERYESLLQAYAWKVTRSEDLGRDVAQEVLMRLWVAPERYRPERASVRSFLLRDCYGRSVDRVRSEDAMRRRGKDWIASTKAFNVSAEEQALVAIEHHELRQLVAELPSSQRQAIVLAYVEGHSYRSVALVLRVPEGTVKSRIRLGLKTLRRQLVTTDI